MKVDYSKYSEEELIDVLANIDAEQFPENAELARAKLAEIRKNFEENIKPNFSGDEKFQYMAAELDEALLNSPHYRKHIAIFIPVIFGLFLFEEHLPATVIVIITIFLMLLEHRSTNREKEIISSYRCPLCKKALDFEKVKTANNSRWHLYCWPCKKMATLAYS